jgi:hypothetical protein
MIGLGSLVLHIVLKKTVLYLPKLVLLASAAEMEVMVPVCSGKLSRLVTVLKSYWNFDFPD